jgi:hypothetical protein
VVDADADSGHRYPNAGAGTLECLLNIGGEPVELDRALKQPPDDDADNEDQDRGDPAQPVEQPVRMMDDVLGGGAALRRPGLLTPACLTAAARRATVACIAGIAR